LKATANFGSAQSVPDIEVEECCAAPSSIVVADLVFSDLNCYDIRVLPHRYPKKRKIIYAIAKFTIKNLILSAIRWSLNFRCFF
jgi:hypothetical protein